MLGALLRLLRGGPDPRVSAREEADRIVQRAEQEARERLIAAQEQSLQQREQLEAEVRDMRSEVQRGEDRLIRREESLDGRNRDLDRRDGQLKSRQNQLDDRAREIEQLAAEEQTRLEQIGNLTADEARAILMGQVETEISDEADRLVRQAEQRVREESDERARNVVATAIQRVASEVTTESTVSVVQLPHEEMKGRIIGREGRNIRALESATGCDLIIDDTPDVVTISGFDPVRREVGRLSLTRLVADGRIHPTRIEEQVEKAQRDVDAIIREAGEEAAIEAHCNGLPRGLIDVFGRLRFRTSYGQNQLRHAVETAHIAAMIADEIKADVNISRRGALLHDVGKSIDHDVEGTHALDRRRPRAALQVARTDRALHRGPPRRGGAAISRSDHRADRRRHLRRPPRRPARVGRPLHRAAAQPRGDRPPRSPASARPSRSRPAARSASSSTRRRSTTSARCGWRATSASRSKKTCSTPARFA